MKYIILEAYSPVSLCEKVEEKLEEGYVCQGGVCVTSENEECASMLFQAMIKKEN